MKTVGETREQLLERTRKLAQQKADEERDKPPEPITEAQYNRRILKALRDVGTQ